MARDRDERAAEVNRLYWETDTPVAEIAERLGISRRALYDLLVPAETGVACPECGGELVYTNRSARMAGEAVCRVCGTPQDLLLLEELTGAEKAPAERAAEAVPPPAPALSLALGEALEARKRERRLLLAAAGVAGLALGVAVALLVRPRRRRWLR
jgi:hypothetical protein